MAGSLDPQQMMPMAAALSGNPQAYADLIQRQLALARQQKLAQMLQEESVSQTPNEVVSGRVVPFTMGQGITKLAQALMARDSNQANDKTAADLAGSQSSLMQGLMQSLRGQPLPPNPNSAQLQDWASRQQTLKDFNLPGALDTKDAVASFTAPHTMSPGQIPLDGAAPPVPNMTLPAVPTGASVTAGPQGYAVAPASGSTGTVAALAGAQAGGTQAGEAPYKTQDIPMPDGSSLTVPTSIAPALAGLTKEDAQYALTISNPSELQAFVTAARNINAGQAAIVSSAQPFINTAPPGASKGMRPNPNVIGGQSTADKMMAGVPATVATERLTAPIKVATAAATSNATSNINAGADVLKGANDAAAGANNTIAGLQDIYRLASKDPGSFGKGSQGYSTFLSYLSRVPGFQGLNEAKTTQDVVGKLSASLAGGGRTDAELNNKLAALPGTEKTADAVKEVIQLLLSQQMHGQARAAVLQHAKDASGGDNGVVQSIAQQFDNIASPRIIASGVNLTQLSNASGANVPNTPANKALAEYYARVKAVPGLEEKIMKLNAMGAF